MEQQNDQPFEIHFQAQLLCLGQSMCCRGNRISQRPGLNVVATLPEIEAWPLIPYPLTHYSIARNKLEPLSISPIYLSSFVTNLLCYR